MKTKEEHIEKLFDEHFKHTPFYRSEIIEFAKKFANQSKWISVEERLPEVNQTVLFNTSHDYVSQGYCIDFDAGDIKFCETFIGNIFDDVTHWQELPKPAPIQPPQKPKK